MRLYLPRAWCGDRERRVRVVPGAQRRPELGDVKPGQHTGQGIDLNGGAWYVMRPSGQPLERILP